MDKSFQMRLANPSITSNGGLAPTTKQMTANSQKETSSTMSSVSILAGLGIEDLLMEGEGEGVLVEPIEQCPFQKP